MDTLLPGQEVACIRGRLATLAPALMTMAAALQNTPEHLDLAQVEAVVSEAAHVPELVSALRRLIVRSWELNGAEGAESTGDRLPAASAKPTPVPLNERETTVAVPVDAELWASACRGAVDGGNPMALYLTAGGSLKMMTILGGPGG